MTDMSRGSGRRLSASRGGVREKSPKTRAIRAVFNGAVLIRSSYHRENLFCRTLIKNSGIIAKKALLS
jgi:hypothetical protein